MFTVSVTLNDGKVNTWRHLDMARVNAVVHLQSYSEVVLLTIANEDLISTPETAGTESFDEASLGFKH